MKFKLWLENVLSADEVAELVRRSPNLANNSRLSDPEVWERFRNRFGYGSEDGPFVSGSISVENLARYIKSGHLRLSGSSTEDGIQDKVNNGLNTVIITAEPGRGMLVVDGNHSLRAAIKRMDDKINVIIDQKYQSLLDG